MSLHEAMKGQEPIHAMTYSILETKKQESKAIEDEIEKYLSNGGSVKQIPVGVVAASNYIASEFGAHNAAAQFDKVRENSRKRCQKASMNAKFYPTAQDNIYHSDANNQIVEQIRQEGGEPLLPDFTNFMLYCLRDAVYDWRYQGGSAWAALGNSLVMRRIEGVRRYMRGALNTSPLSAHVMPVAHIDDLARLGEKVMSLGNSAGEGWLLPAEMLEFLEHGTSNILCLQPFGCLPNHVVGRGAFKAVRRQRSEANIMALDYDPGSSEANQLNRIRLFMAIAREKEKEREEAARHARHTYTHAGGYSPGDYWQ